MRLPFFEPPNPMHPSTIIAGTMNWGVWGAKMTTQQIAQTIEASLEAGVYAFDHADIYGGYTTEQDFGDGFAASGVSREQVVFVSKCGIRYPSEGATHSVKHYDYSAEYIENALEKSLRKLQTDYIDVFLLHRPSPLLDPRVAVPVLEKLRGQGKIKEWGVSNFTPSQLALIGTEGTPHWNQIECSLTHTTPMLDGTLDFHQSHSIGTMAWSPLGGFFKEPGAVQDRLEPVIHRMLEKYSCTVECLLLAWLFRHPAGIIPVVGTTRVDRIQAMAKAHKIELETEDWFALTEASWGHKVP